VAFEEIRASGAVAGQKRVARGAARDGLRIEDSPDFELLEFLGKDLATQGEIEQLFYEASCG